MQAERRLTALVDREASKTTRDLDPLGVDIFILGQMPIYNNSNNLQGILENMMNFIPKQEVLEGFSLYESRAAIRDLGIIAASLQKHDIAVSDVPMLEESLVALGNKTCEVPRETVFHYGPWNPEGERMRTFTGTEGERFFIDSFRSGMQELDTSIQLLMRAQDISVTDPDFAELVNISRVQFELMIEAMIKVRRRITPEFFTSQLRPYFPVLNIHGHEYQAPGGAQMPVLVIDKILWGADEEDPDYQGYYQENQAYLPIEYRTLAISIKESLVSKFVRESKASPGSQTDLSAESLRNYLSSLLSFRYPHLKTAKENFAIRDEDARGSGGYSPSILENLIEHTTEAKQRIR